MSNAPHRKPDAYALRYPDGSYWVGIWGGRNVAEDVRDRMQGKPGGKVALVPLYLAPPIGQQSDPQSPDDRPKYSDADMAFGQDRAVEKFLQQTFELADAPPDGDPPEGLPEAWGEKPLARIRWAEDAGDRNEGIQGWSGFALSQDQKGTLLDDLLNASRSSWISTDAALLVILGRALMLLREVSDTQEIEFEDDRHQAVPAELADRINDLLSNPLPDRN